MTASATKFEKGARVQYLQGTRTGDVWVSAIFCGIDDDGDIDLALSGKDAELYGSMVCAPESKIRPDVTADSPAAVPTPVSDPAPASQPTPADPDQQVLDYLKILFEPGDRLCFATATKADFYQGPFVDVDSLDRAFVKSLREKNTSGLGIYVAMNPLIPGTTSRYADTDFKEARCVFFEVDHSGDAVLSAVRAAVAAGTIPPPTVILRSSPGKYQFVWRVNSSRLEFTAARIKAVNAALVSTFKGDNACKDVLRFFRLPTFSNQKYSERPVCDLIETNNIAVRYNFADFPSAPIEEATSKTPNPAEMDQAIRYFEDNADQIKLSISYLKDWNGHKAWELACPWLDSHTDRKDSGTAVLVFASGALDFSCLHDSCRERTWQDMRTWMEAQAGHSLAFADPGPTVNLNGTSLSQQAPADQAWADPEPIASYLLPVLPFKLSFLPSSMKNWAKDVSERMSVPLDFVGISVLCALAGCINRRAFVYPKQNDHTWKEAISVSGAVIAHSGRKKTPTWKTMTGPMYEIEAKWQDEYNKRLGLYETEMARFKEAEKLRVKASKKDESDAGDLYNSTKPPKGEPEPTKPEPRRRLIVNDSTPESMHAIMSDNPEGLFVYRDELSGWIAELDAKGRESERSMFLAAMNGSDPHTLDRIGRGSITSTMSASLFGGFQPDPLIEFLCDTRNTSDGLVARFGLLVWPDGGVSPRIDRAPDEMARAGFRHALQILSALKQESVCLRFSIDAQDIFNDWCDVLYSRIPKEENTGKRSHISKYDGLLARLVGLLQLADIAAVISSLEGGTYLIDADHLNRAIDLLAYLESHASRVYACVKGPEQIARESLAQRIQDQALRDGFTVREIERNRWKGLAKQYAGGALDDLEDLGWIRQLPPSGNGKGGRPSVRYVINPKLKAIKGVTS